MSEATERGITDHLKVQLFEHMDAIVQRRREAGHRLGPRAGSLIEAHVIEALGRRWWERRGYTFPSPGRTDANDPIG